MAANSLGGLALWVAAVVVTFVTANPNLIPTVVLLGSFLVPVTFVAWAWERRETGELTPSLILTAFTAGGVLGVCAASVLEAYLLDPSPWLFLGVGLIEEAPNWPRWPSSPGTWPCGRSGTG